MELRSVNDMMSKVYSTTTCNDDKPQPQGLKRSLIEDEEEGNKDESVRLGLGRNHYHKLSQALLAKKSCNPNTRITNLSSNDHNNLKQHLSNSYPTRQQYFVHQRQEIFNISMFKLTRFRQSSDPSLVRSVLICNMLRKLERELAFEGIKINFGPNGVSFNDTQLASNLDVGACWAPNETCSTPSPSPLPPTSTPSLSSTSLSSPPQTHSYFHNDICETEDVPMERVALAPTPPPPPPCLKSSPLASTIFFDENASRPDSPASAANQTSAFWCTQDASDRLTSLNWSSVLKFNSNNSTSIKSEPSSSLETKENENVNSNEPIEPTNGASQIIPANNSLISTSRNIETNDDNSKTSLTTLLPPISAPTTSTCNISPSSITQKTSTFCHNGINVLHTICQTTHAIHHARLSSLTSQSPNSKSTTTEEIFGDIDLSLYDFDLLSPLSPPNGIKLAPVTAEELIRTIDPTDSKSRAGECSSS